MKLGKVSRIVTRVAAIVAAVVVVALCGVKVQYGGGKPYAVVGGEPLLAQGPQVLVELDFPPGNVTSSRGGRIFFNTHPFAQSHRFADAFLFELVDGAPRPYPDAASQLDERFVFGMTVDTQERLWVTSPATLDRARTRIQAFELATNRRVVDHELEPGVGRFAQDLRVSSDGTTLFLADTGAFRFTHAALLTVDVRDWSVREVLASDSASQAQDWAIQTAGGPYRIGFGLLTFQVGLDGIALSANGDWLYFGAMSNDTLYRVRTADVRNPGLSSGDLGRRLERIGQKPLSDGIAVAQDGSVLVTDVEHGGIVRVDASGDAETLVRDTKIVWADGVQVTQGGDVLFTDSSIPSYIDPLLRAPTLERLRAGRPYRIYEFHLPGHGPSSPK